MDIQLSDVGHIIQLSVAPVFLLTGVGSTMMVLTNRLARIVDRSRVLEEKLGAVEDATRIACQNELHILYARAHMINRAIILSVACAFMVSLVIVSLFVGDAFSLELSKVIASFFVLGMLCLLGSFSFLLREILTATQVMYKDKVMRIHH
tara:strand:- start:314776 stop:315225 length:450 start_codon:yes stop_codon:yes gene_type:complete